MGEFIISAFKFIIAILLLPLVVACSVSFADHLKVYPATYEDFLIWGIFAFLLLFLFLHQFWGFYEFGQKIIGSVVKFIAPLDRLVTNLLPFYLLVILLTFYLTKVFFKIKTYDPYFVFFVGFTLAMHIILVAQEMQNQEKAPIKSTYLLQICFVFLALSCLCVLFLDLIVGKWTFSAFFTSTLDTSWEYYIAIIKKMTAY